MPQLNQGVKDFPPARTFAPSGNLESRAC